MAAENPSVSGVSGRYATALFELARDEKSIDAVKADLDKFEALLVESADLLQGQKAVGIMHNGSLYRLQATKLGKLILTK